MPPGHYGVVLPCLALMVSVQEHLACPVAGRWSMLRRSRQSPGPGPGWPTSGVCVEVGSQDGLVPFTVEVPSFGALAHAENPVAPNVVSAGVANFYVLECFANTT